MAARVPDRTWVRVLVVLFLVAFTVSALGVELPRPPTAEPLLPGVRARAATAVVRTGASAPPGEFAYFDVASDGTLVVSDRQRRSVLRFSPRGELLSEWGPNLSGVAPIQEPAGVAVLGDTTFVVDRGPGAERIIRVSREGRVEGTIDLKPFGPYGLNGLTVQPNGNVVVADTGRNRLFFFTPTGQLVRQVGQGGKEPGQLLQPMQTAVAADGSLYIADMENKRIQRWDAELTAREHWSVDYEPFGITVDPLGRVYVPDHGRRRVEVFSPRGTLIGELGTPPDPAIDLSNPKQLTFGADPNTLFVLGSNGITRLDLENLVPPSQSAGITLDPRLLGIVPVLGLLGAWLLLRRRGRGVKAPALESTPGD